MKKGLYFLIVSLLFAFVSVTNVKAASHTLHFDSNGGKPAAIPDVVGEDGTEFTVPTATKDGVEFGGWYYVDETIPEDSPARNVPLEGNQIKAWWPTEVTYYANWVETIDSVNINVNLPIGTEITTTSPISENTVTVPAGAKYGAFPEGAGLIKSYDDDSAFVGTIEEGKDYYIELWVSPNGGVFTENTVVKVNGKDTFKIGQYYVNAEGKLDPSLTNYGFLMYAKVTATFNEKTGNQKYTISSNTNSGDSISFTAPEGIVYSFYIQDRKDTTDEELQEIADLINDPEFTFEKLKAQLNKLIGYGKNAAGDGTLLKLYEIYLYDNGVEVHQAEGGFKIKLKMTDDMKGYDSYKLVYIADDGTTENAIELTKNGEYLEGTLPHLSMYALVGSKTETTTVTNTTNNPATGDNIMFYISILGLSVIGLAVAGIYTKKKRFD